ncbi:hypothetical protein DCCM_4392 [Desulfocucumis palustris]|uniref:Uncharacterized protein n=1 Tax=Desulfocucumis palustris TaxID=1898651 RepID=A0A2L2XFY8_9FIRM|nr:hypothetical protein [Desulfocucumis palustris]GBF35269.1 hypothetical protein DCCM_4392 [Desulfocucumis palustris]
MIKKKLAYWISGTLTAFTGVYAVRVLSLQMPDSSRVTTLLTGYILAIAGLFIITLGTRKKNT